jgi:sugar O-acyltransferase (sialic acid O-acetyltransferase NeuD family)
MLIIGTGGCAKQVILALLRSEPFAQPYFFNNIHQTETSLFLGRFPILQTLASASVHFRETDAQYALAIGQPRDREKLDRSLLAAGGTLSHILDPSAILSDLNVQIQSGLTCFANVVVEPSVSIGRGVLLNVGAFIAHDCHIGNYTAIGPGAKLLGGVRVGALCQIGAGAIILPGICIGNDAIIGAGAVVTSDVPAGKTYVGVPAKSILPE